MLVNYGSVAMPFGAVVEGEIVDPDAVSGAIRELWKRHGFRVSDVAIGVSNQKVVVRLIDLPFMERDELEGAIQYQAQDYIPIPVEEAIIDFQIIGDYMTPTDEHMMELLLVAAQRDMIQTAVAAVEGAKLRLAQVDVTAFALVRSLLGTTPSWFADEGGNAGEAPLAFIGKGVCFDTGGISIKPAASMEDMKGDMAGAACVTGLMHALAARKARVNAVGVIGLVENMPDGNAQRPGDIVTSMSGQTIEIINTDAEGRLVLADVIWYAAKRFKPKFMVDLATLTGAIIVALGQEYAGMFSNDDKLCERLTKAGEATGELVWRMPLNAAYDKMIDSKFADMKNTGGSRWGGAITAAQFIQRFVADKTPWAHLDIAGTGFDSRQNDINKSWGSGWGVRLLDRLVADYYER